MKRTAVVGVGNSILGDDGAGIAVGRRLCEMLHDDDVAFVEEPTVGLRFFDVFDNFERIIIIDAMLSRTVGALYKIDVNNLHHSAHLSSHGIDIFMALRLFQETNGRQPEVSVYGVGVNATDEFKENLSRELDENIDEIAKRIAEVEF